MRSILSRLGLALWLAIPLGCANGGIDAPPVPSDDGAVETSVDDVSGTDTTSDDTATGSDDGVDTGVDTGTVVDTPTGTLDPPSGASSGGSGGGAASGVVKTTPGGTTYRLIAPGGGSSQPLLVVFSGTEGGATMTSNLMSVRSVTGTSSFLFAVLDGPTYYGMGAPGAEVLDDVRKAYDVDNDRTYLLGESAGTRSALQLGFQLRQSYFAAYWANDVNASGTPAKTAAALGFAPFGNAGPGGDFADANAIVSAMKAAGYRTPAPAPYDGTGAGTHGATEQFLAALSWFPGKSRK